MCLAEIKKCYLHNETPKSIRQIQRDLIEINELLIGQNTLKSFYNKKEKYYYIESEKSESKYIKDATV